jgi:hypothetical protein
MFRASIGKTVKIWFAAAAALRGTPRFSREPFSAAVAEVLSTTTVSFRMEIRRKNPSAKYVVTDTD